MIFSKFLRETNEYSIMQCYLHNITFFLFSTGPAIIFAFIAALFKYKVNYNKKFKIYVIVFIATFLLLTLIQNQAIETDRLWLFLTPFFFIFIFNQCDNDRCFFRWVLFNQILFYLIIFHLVPLHLTADDLKNLIQLR